MIYFSEIRSRKVYTEDQVYLGKLDDLIFLASVTPTITKLVINDLKNNVQIIPALYLKKINKKIIINKAFSTSTLQENELYVLKNLLDKQIIDIKGNKIIRVNDVALQEKGEEEKVKGTFYIAGVDVGLVGILRALGLEKSFRKLFKYLNISLKSEFLSWTDIQILELARGSVKLKRDELKLRKIKAEDLADYLERTNVSNIRKLLKVLDEKQAADVISSLNVNLQVDLLKNYNFEKVAKLLLYLDSDDAADILLTLPQRKIKEILSFFPENKKNKLQYLIDMSITQIGKLLTLEYLTVHPNDTVGEVINLIKKNTGDYSYLNHIYVVSETEQLIGVFDLHELLIEDLDTPTYKFMLQDVIIVYLTSAIELTLKKMLKYKLHSLPVVDNNKKILGIITIVDLIAAYLKEKHDLLIE